MGILGKKGKFAQKKERKGLWRGAVTGIAAIVVFCTTYALILPAITMETQGLSCGLAEHTHSQDCYQLICGKQEYFSHSHSDECYENGALVCTLTERTLHHHSEDCYSKPEPICGLTEGQGHTHAESCYTTERTLVCTQSECSPHTHSDGCYTEEAIPCTQEAVEGHTHGEDCYTDGERTCGKEETQGHTHSEACTQTKQVLTCTLAETQGHRHSDECYEEKQLLSCGQEAREAHTHSESCYPSDFQPTLICGQEDIPEHRHSQDCCARICELEEHTHSELCVENHEAFLENQNEILKSSEEQSNTQEDSQEQASNEEGQNQQNSQEQASNEQEQNQENSQQQTSNEEGQNQENSQEQSSNNEAQSQENSQEQASDNEAQNQENSQQQASNNEEQNQQNSQEQASNEQTQNQQNSQQQASDEEEQTQENLTDDDNPADGDANPENEVDWTDSEAAIEAGFYPICESYEEEHVHTEECYITAEQLESYLSQSQHNLGSSQWSAAKATAAGSSSKMTDVASPLTMTGGSVSYDVNSDSYSLNLSIDFKLNTAPNYTKYDSSMDSYWVKESTYHITDGSVAESNAYVSTPTGFTNEDIYTDVGTVFTMDLGDLKITDDNLFNGTYNVYQGTSKVGTYTLSNVNGHVVVTISLDPELVANAQNGLTGHMELNASLGKESFSGGEDLTYTTPDGAKIIIKDSEITYPPGTSRDGDISISKYGSYSVSGKELTYSVTVSSKNGTPGAVQIQDVMTANGINIESLKSVKLDGAELTTDQYNYTPSNGTHTISMELDALPEGAWGGTYRTITYVYQLAEAPESDTVVNNEVRASSRKDASSDPLVSTAEKPVTVSPTPVLDTTPNLSKSNMWGNSDESRNQTVIPWKLTINDNNQNLAGMTLTDEMLKNLTNASDIKVYVDGSQVTDETQYGFTADYTNGTITFPSGEAANTHKYEILYYTPVPDSLKQWGNAKVTNIATLGEKTAPSTVEQTNGKVSKENGTLVSVTDGKLTMNWKVEVDTALDGLAEEFVLSDFTRTGNWDPLHYYQSSSIVLSYAGVSLVKDSDYTITFYDANNAVTTGSDAVKMEIAFLTTGTNHETMRQGFQKLTLTYSTVADAPNAGTTYQNKVSYREQDVSTYATYSPPTVVKTDGNGQTGTTTNTSLNGNLVWKVKAVSGSLNGSSASMTIIDTLPEGIEVVSLNAVSNVSSLGWWYNDNALDISSDGIISGGNDKFSFSGFYAKDSRTVTVELTRSTDSEFIPVGTEFTLVLNCKPTEEYLAAHPDKTGQFKNTAEAKLGDASLGTVEQTQNWEATPDDPFKDSLKKDGTWKYVDQTIDYHVTINPKGYDLNPDNAKLYLTDEFTYYPKPGELDLVYQLIQNSVKLYYASTDESGNLVKGSAVTDDWRWTADEEHLTEFNKVKKIIRLEVPDSTPLILEYSYLLSQYNQDVTYFNLNASNQIYYNNNPGASSTNSKEYEPWQKSSSSAIIQTGRSYSITKVAEGNSSIAVKGAKFRIYQAVQAENGSWNWSQVTLTGTDQTVRQDYTTDSFGKILVEASHGYQPNVLYKLQEYYAPDGYILPKNPQELKFYFGDASDTTNVLPDASSSIMSGAKDLMKESVNAYVANTPSAVNFSVEKQWKTFGGDTLATPPMDSLNLTLMRVGAEQKANTTVDDPLASMITVNLIIGSYGSNGAPVNKIYTVPKGTVFNVDLAYGTYTSTPVGVLYLKEQAHVQSNIPFTYNETTKFYSFSYTATYSVCIEIQSRIDTGYYTYYYSYTAPSTGSSESNYTPLVVGPESCGTITLTAGNNWKWSSKDANLPAQGIVKDDEGNDRTVWYTYYVLENLEGYTVTYSNQKSDGSMIGISTGSITVTNTQPENPPSYASLSVEKSWEQAVASEMPDSVKFKLYRKAWTGSADSANLDAPYGLSYDSTADEMSAAANGTVTLIGEYQLTKAGDWKWSSSGLSLLAQSQGISYTYFILEEPSEDYDISYGTREITNGTLTLTNTMHPAYTLPNTGGMGTEIYTAAGLAVSIGAVLGLMKKRKKGERE